jgi:Phage Mu protein F like protein
MQKSIVRHVTTTFQMKIRDKKKYARNFYLFTIAKEKKYSKLFSNTLLLQIKQFIESYKKNIGVENAINKIDAENMHNILKGLYYEIAAEHGPRVRKSIIEQKNATTIGFSEKMISLMKSFYEIDILNHALNITETTKAKLKLIMIKAEQEGLSIDGIVALIDKSMLTEIRARRIARTEIVTAANVAGKLAAKDTGLNLRKGWLSTKDNRTRKHHVSIDGAIVGIDELFNLGNGVMMDTPGDRGGKNGQLQTPAKEVVNCRCTTLYLTD